MNPEKVMFSVSQLRIMTAKHVLEEAGIAAVSLNQVDSAHGGAFGDIKLFVDKERAAEARAILIDHEIIEE